MVRRHVARLDGSAGGWLDAVDYLLTVAPNENGVALQADRDSVQRRALFLREEGKWVVGSWHQ